MRPLLMIAAATAALVCSSAPARASLLPGPCPVGSTAQPFLPWLDFMQYVPAPDGGLEGGGAGWTLRGGAAVVDGNEPWRVAGDSDRRSLALPAGAWATTAPMCAGLNHPTLRFFAQRTGGSPLAQLRVDAIHDGGVLPVGVVTLAGEWRPTLPMVIAGNLLPHLGADRAAVAFRFTARDGAFRIDDVFVDPYGRY